MSTFYRTPAEPQVFHGYADGIPTLTHLSPAEQERADTARLKAEVEASADRCVAMLRDARVNLEVGR